MRIKLLCVSKRPVDWVRLASDDYLKRLKGQLDVAVLELAPAVKPSTSALGMAKEATKLQSACPAGALIVALDERGANWATSDLATRLDRWRGDYADLVFMIGGADGLAPELRDNAAEVWSLSRLTLPHQLARVIAIEQIYRAWSLLHNHPYHRA